MQFLLQKSGVSILAAALLIPASTLAQADDHDGCTDATLKGDYAFTITGQILPPVGPLAQRPPGSAVPVPASIHSDAEKLWVRTESRP